MSKYSEKTLDYDLINKKILFKLWNNSCVTNPIKFSKIRKYKGFYILI